MYPYKIQPIEPKNLLDEIILSEDGAKIYINEFTHIVIHKGKKDRELNLQPIPYKPHIVEVVEPPREPEKPAEQLKPDGEITIEAQPGDKVLPRVTGYSSDRPREIKVTLRRRCDNSKCPTPTEKFLVDNMAERSGKFYCTLDCCGEASGAIDDEQRVIRRNKAIKKSGLNGRWSKKYDTCQDCGTTKRPYTGNGYCRGCYHKH